MKTIPAAIAKVNAGDSMIIRAGTYTYTSTISISKNKSELNAPFKRGIENSGIVQCGDH